MYVWSTCNAGDLGSIHGSGRSPGEGNVNPLQYSCLENSMTEDPGRIHPWDCRIAHNGAIFTLRVNLPIAISEK